MTEYTDVFACTDCHYHHPKTADTPAEDDKNFVSEAIDHIAMRTAEGALTGLIEAARAYMSRKNN